MSLAKDRPLQLGLAGCGKMGGAMVRAWLAADTAASIDILDPHTLPDDLSSPNIAFYTDEDAFMEQAADWDLLFIAIKPQIMGAFRDKIKSTLPPHLTVLSIAAGQTIAGFESAFGKTQPIIRAMPNTPAAIGRGMTVACANAHTTAAHRDMASALLANLGQVEWIADESLLDAVTAVSGSGPAYVFYLIEIMTKAGIDSGLPPALAETLARQTVIGSAALAESEPLTPAGVLRENVTSPNGTTAAALSVLMDGKFQDIMTQAIAKATARSKELSA